VDRKGIKGRKGEKKESKRTEKKIGNKSAKKQNPVLGKKTKPNFGLCICMKEKYCTISTEAGSKSS